MQLAVLGELEGELLAWLEQAQGIRALELVDEVQIRGAEAEALEDDPMLSPLRTFTCLVM